MNFNKELYREYRRVAGQNEKDGMFDVTRFPNGLYCFATQQCLGDNGRINNHPMLDKKFRRVNDDKIYVLDQISIHWYDVGYYYHATLRDENNSHVSCFIENINCNNEIILEGISRFKNRYSIIED